MITMNEREREFHEYMKTRRGLANMLGTFPPQTPVETAIGAEWLMWNYPY